MKWKLLKWILAFALFTDLIILILALVILFESQNLQGTILTFSVEAMTLTFSNLISLIGGFYIGQSKENKKYD